MSNTLRVLRVHLVTWPGLLIWPWAILATSFLVNLAVFGAVHAQQANDDGFTGGMASIYCVVLVICAQWAAQVFPLTLGMSATRRSFYAASALLLLGGSLGYGVLLYLLSLVERATDGWGVSMHFFGLEFMAGHGALAILMYTVPFLVFGFIGLFTGLVHKRWGVNGLFSLALGALVVFGGGTALVTWQGRWHAIGHWFTSQSAVALMAGWPAILAALLAAAGYLAVRRATA